MTFVWRLLLLALLCAAQARAESPLVLHGGKVYTLDPARPWASAVVVREGRIAYVGDDAGALTAAGPDARRIALKGRMVLPGFHDSHTHPMSGGLRLIRCQLGEAKTVAALYATVRACASAHRQRPWLLGAGWSPQMFGDAGPSLAKLDELVPDQPAFLTTADGFTGWVNSRALKMADLPATSGVVDGEAAERVRALIPKPREAEYRLALQRSTAMANRFGITSLVDASASPAMVDAYHAADTAGELPVRVVAAQRVDLARGPEQVDEMIERRVDTVGRRFRANAAKMFLDGEIDRRTAAMLEPYEGTPDLRGELLIQPSALNAIVQRLDRADFFIHMHAMGDRAVRVGLDAIDIAFHLSGPGIHRYQLAHIGVADPQDIGRFQRLGVAANFQPLFFDSNDPLMAAAMAAIGPKRARWLYPMARVGAGGAQLLASSDWPSSSMNPLDAIQAAVTRQPAQERVALRTMLAAYTINAARAVAIEDAMSGSIEVGKLADLIVVDRNLFEIPAGEIHKARVLLTLLNGESVYRDPRF